MIRFCSAVAVLLVTLALAFVPGPGTARAQPETEPVVPLPAPSESRFVELSVSSVEPRTVTASTPDVTVLGQVRNVGDRDVRDLEIRLQRAPRIDTGAGLRATLRTPDDAVEAAGPFELVTDVLAPAATADFRVSVPTSGPGSMLLTEPGVYPVLVNLNGEPDFGATARLDATPFLLPVTTPPDDTPPDDTGTTPPTTLTVLWPLADRPRLLPVGADEQPLLTDDELGASFAAGGRLHGLLDAVVTSPPGIRAGLCLAVDPDLVLTAEAMAAPAGYRVREGAGTVPGGGATAAMEWLEEVRGLAADTCVVATPWALADVNAIAGAGLAAQQRGAVARGAPELERLLGVDTVGDLTWTPDGLLSDAAAAQLVELGQRSVVIDADAVASPSSRVVRTADGGLGALLSDPPTSIALDPTTVGAPDGAGPVAIQNAVGAMSWPVLTRAADTPPDAPPGAPDTVLVAPPPVWGVEEAQAGALLAAVADLVSTGQAVPRTLASLISAGDEADTRAALAYPPTAPGVGVPITEAVAVVDRRLTSFADATSTDVQSRTDPATVVEPLRESLVRALSTAPTPDAEATGPRVVAEAVSALLGGISLQNPDGVYTLASEESPLLLVIRNELSLQAGVRVVVTGPPGLRVGDVGVQQLPARSARQLVLPTSISRTGQFAVTVSLMTSTGTALGEPTQIVVLSRAYGTATAAVTGGAAAVLVLLVVRRLWHRFRGRPDQADAERGDP